MTQAISMKMKVFLINFRGIYGVGLFYNGLSDLCVVKKDKNFHIFASRGGGII